MRVRRRVWVGVVALLAICLLIGLGIDVYQRRFVGTTYEFPVTEQAAFLTEQTALEAARETLVRDGLDAAAWSVHPSGRSTAPDGRPDEFLSRNRDNPNLGTVRFRNGERADRFVSVELVGDRLVCHGSWGK